MDDPFWDRLLQDGLLTAQDVEQAKARHRSAGGAPDTALLEVRPLDTDERVRLRRLVARAVDLPVAPQAFLDAPEPAALSLLPKELADRHSVLAVQLTPHLLTIVTPPMTSRTMAELSFVVGRKVQPYIALENDIRQALQRHLGLPVPARVASLGLATLPASSSAPPGPVPPPSLGPQPASSSATTVELASALKEVDRAWSTAAPTGPRRSMLSSLPPAARAPESTIPNAPQKDWVGRAAETLREAIGQNRLTEALDHIAAPGMLTLVWLARSGDTLVGLSASMAGQPVAHVTSLRLGLDGMGVDTVIGKSALRGSTRCGPFRPDAHFDVLVRTLGLAPPADVMVAPIKQGERIVGVFVGDNGGQAISPVTASAVRRLQTAVAEIWPQHASLEPFGDPPPAPAPAPLPAPSAALRTTQPPTLVGLAIPGITRAEMAAASAPPNAVQPVEPDSPPWHVPLERGKTAELVALRQTDLGRPRNSTGPLAAPPEPVPSPKDAPLPASEIEATHPSSQATQVLETLMGMPIPAPVPDEDDLPDFVPEPSAAQPEPGIDVTRPGQAILGTRPMMPSMTESRMPAVSAPDETSFDFRPMALAELADAMALEDAHPTETLSAVAALPAVSGRSGAPSPQLLDLDSMATVPSLRRIRPQELAAPSALIEMPRAPEPAHHSGLPFPMPGWGDELGQPAVTAVRSVRIESETDVDLAPLRLAAALPQPAHAPVPALTAPPAVVDLFDEGTIDALDAAPMPAPVPVEAQTPHIDRASGPQPRITVTVTPAPFSPPESAAPAAVKPRPVVTDGDVRAAIEALQRPDVDARNRAEDLLLTLGEPALDLVFAAFPGQLAVDRLAHPAGAVPVEQHSGLLHLVVRSGSLAIPRLEALSGHLSPDVRYYAIFCFSALRSQRSLSVVADRLHDADTTVRDLAIWVLEQYRSQVAFVGILDRLKRELTEGLPRRRRPIVDAVGRLHLVEAVPELLGLLTDLSLGLQEPALRALQEITRADLGMDAWKWQKWVERNKARPRVEWLLEGLLSDHRHIRSGAFQELRRLTHQNYGYMVDAPPAERRSAYDRWSRWWRDSGKERFASYR